MQIGELFGYIVAVALCGLFVLLAWLAVKAINGIDFDDDDPTPGAGPA